MIIIGLGHQPRVGKDTVARFLISHLRVTGNRGAIQKESLTYTLRIQCHKLYGWAGLHHPDYYMTEAGLNEYGVILPKLGKTPQQIWTTYLDGLCGIYEPTLIESLLDSCKSADILIIPDLTRPCEIERIHDKGGYVVRIDKPDTIVSTDLLSLAMTAYTDWDLVIHNDGDLNKLHSEVVRVATELNL